ncbi:MAG: peptidylprolyl isomerase [Campylobacterota bacterium]|nr:peptidylprolyl isomerase [Campylobacterota bacterium]
MITWMQRHKKYLIVTIWISTIAFVGAGFVGWGQYNYGDKAGAVAKVGNIEITMGELQKSYSRIYSQYAQMFQGNFDEEKAKQFGLKRQALDQLTQQTLILNLAQSYDLQITDKELLAEIKQQDYFSKDGVFNKEIYKSTLSRNNISVKEYEQDVRKQLLIQKTLKLFPTDAKENEINIFNTLMSIADKINYKVLDSSQIKLDTSDKNLKPFWENMQQSFMTEVTYDIEYIKHETVSTSHDENKIQEYYNENKTHFKDDDGKILPLEETKDAVITELNIKSTKKSALRTYISYKKNQLDKNIQLQKSNISELNNPFHEEVLEKISALSLTSPFLKPVLVDDTYYTFKLLKVNSSKTKTFKEAKKEVISIFIKEKTKQELISLAQNSQNNFVGITTDFITSQDAIKLDEMPINEANEFLIQLFSENKKTGYITLQNGKIVLYKVLEQKLLDSSKDLSNASDSIARLKSNIFNDGLIKNLQKKYKTEIFIEGL